MPLYKSNAKSLDKIAHLARFRKLMYIEYTALVQAHDMNDFLSNFQYV